MAQLLDALTALEAALAANERRHERMRARIAEIREERAAGRSYPEIVRDEQRPLVVELLTESAQALDRIGAQVRRIEAHALHSQGMTMDEIAHHFGVTRQRISALLREARSAEQLPAAAAAPGREAIVGPHGGALHSKSG